MTPDELSAREELRELVASYTHLGDGGRLDELVALFAPDGWLDADRVRYEGHDGIDRFFRGIVSGRESSGNRTFVRHHVANVTIALDGPDAASGASYWTVYSDDGFESSGRYRDAYRRGTDGRWRFASRTIRRDRPRVAATSTAGDQSS